MEHCEKMEKLILFYLIFFYFFFGMLCQSRTGLPSETPRNRCTSSNALGKIERIVIIWESVSMHARFSFLWMTRQWSPSKHWNSLWSIFLRVWQMLGISLISLCGLDFEMPILNIAIRAYMFFSSKAFGYWLASSLIADRITIRTWHTLLLLHHSLRTIAFPFAGLGLIYFERKILSPPKN
jgi:hypothetical protein